MFLALGKQINGGRGVYRYSTAAAHENPIKPPVSVQYDQLLIDGKFVDAASGELSDVEFMEESTRV